MHDFTSHVWLVCSSNFFAEFKYMSSDGKTEYVATLARYNPGPYQVNWDCTCPGFQFRGKCKHIEQAEKDNCYWGQSAFWGSPEKAPDDGICPDCGRELQPVEVAV
jgi:hypothetical protein